MNRGEIWLAHLAESVAEITTSIRGIAAEVRFDHAAAGLESASVVNCDGIHTVAQTTLTTYVGSLDDVTLDRVCSAVSYALGCRAPES